MPASPTKVENTVKKNHQIAYPIYCYTSPTLEVDSRARRGVGTLRLNRRGSLIVSGQVLADKAGYLQHVEARHREDRLQRTVGLDDPPFVELVRLDVNPDLLRDLGARKRLRAADSRQSRAQDLLGEDAFPSLLHPH